MADSTYEKEAFEEIYKHPDWKMEAEKFEVSFTKALYDDESVKKEGQDALVQVSNVLIAYNRVKDAREAGAEFYTRESDEVKKNIQDLEAKVKALEGKKDQTPKDKKDIENYKALIETYVHKLQELQDSEINVYADALNEFHNNDDEGTILSSTMLGGVGNGGMGYTLTDNSVQDTRKGAQYIRDQMTDKGSLLDQMALLDNAMNTGGIDLDSGTEVDVEEIPDPNNPKKKKKVLKKSNEKNVSAPAPGKGSKKTLHDLFTDKELETDLMITGQRSGANGTYGLNLSAVQEFNKLSKEKQEALIGTEGSGENRKSLTDAMFSRQATEEAKQRKKDKTYIGPFSQQGKKEEKKKWEIDATKLTNRQIYMLMRQGLYDVNLAMVGEGNDKKVTDESRPKGLKIPSRMTEGQQAVVDRIIFEQRRQQRDDAKRNRSESLLTGSGTFNKDDTAENKLKLDERDKTIAQQLNEKGFLTTKDAEEVIQDPTAKTGRLMNTPKAARNMMAMYKLLTPDQNRLLRFRLALMAYLVPSRRNTIYEVLSMSHEAGVKGNEDLTDAAHMYETISPFSKEEIRGKLSGKRWFPHENIFYKYVMEYGEARNQKRGLTGDKRVPMVNGMERMSVAEIARELLNPANGLALFAKLRLLTDQSITDADIRKCIDRLPEDEQQLVNELMEMTAFITENPPEALKDWLDKYREDSKEVQEKLKEKQDALNKVIVKLTEIQRNNSEFSRNAGKKEEQEARALESEIRDLEKRASELSGDEAQREEKQKKYNKIRDWEAGEKKPKAIAAVAKIRGDLFHLLTATPTSYETDAEAADAEHRNKLLVITRLANRFFMDGIVEKQLKENPETKKLVVSDQSMIEDTYHYLDYNPSRDDQFEKQLQEERNGTLGMGEVTKEERRRQLEKEQKEREEAERKYKKEVAERKALKDRIRSLMLADKPVLLPAELKNKKTAKPETVAAAIRKVADASLNFSPSAIMSLNDMQFVDSLPRILEFQNALAQIKELLSDRKDAKVFLHDTLLTKIRTLSPMMPTLGKYVQHRGQYMTQDLYSKGNAEEFAAKMENVRKAQAGDDTIDITAEETKAYNTMLQAQSEGERLREMEAEGKQEDLAGTDTGYDYMEKLYDFQKRYNEAKEEDDPRAEAYGVIAGHLSNLIAALNGTFGSQTDIGTEAAKIAALFGILQAACDEYLPDEEEELEQDGLSERETLVKEIYNAVDGKVLSFGTAAYRTAEILSKTKVLEAGGNHWYRVMSVGKKALGQKTRLDSVSSRLSLDSDTAMSKLDIELDEQQRRVDSQMTKRRSLDDYGDLNPRNKNANDVEGRSLNRYRNLLNADNKDDFKNKLKDLSDRAGWKETIRSIYNDNLLPEMEEGELQDALMKKIEAKEAERKKRREEWEKAHPKKEEKPPEPEVKAPEVKQPEVKEPEPKEPDEQEIAATLEAQKIENIMGKTGEEDAFIQIFSDLIQELSTHKTGIFGFFGNKQVNDEIAYEKSRLQLIINKLKETVPGIERGEDNKITNMKQIQDDYLVKMKSLYTEIKNLRQHAFYLTGSGNDETPFQKMQRKIKEALQPTERELKNVINTNIDPILNNPTRRKEGTEDKVVKDPSLGQYVTEQGKEGKLRMVFFVLMTKTYIGSEGGYAKPEKWETEESLRKKKPKKEEPPKNEPPKNENIIQNEEENLDESFDLNKSYSNLDITLDENEILDEKNENEDEEEDEKEAPKNEPLKEEDIDKEVKNLEENLKDGEYEDEEEYKEEDDGPVELTEEEQKAAKDLARQKGRALADQARANVKEWFPNRDTEFKAPKVQRKKTRDDFSIGFFGEPEGPEEEAAQRAVAQRTFAKPGRPLRTKDKAAKIVSWSLLAPIRLIGIPVKWIGGGLIAGLNKAVRWTKKKTVGMQLQKSSATAEANERRRQEIDSVKKKPENQEIMADGERVPMNWAQATAENPEKEPTVTIGVTDKGDADKDFGAGSGGHTWMQISYTRRDPVSKERTRYHVDVGYGPKGGTGNNLVQQADAVTNGSMIPGALWNERGNSFAAGKRYTVTNRQVNQMLLEAERYPAGGFNVISRNCTTFVADVTQSAGVNTGDILKKSQVRLGGFWVGVPFLSLVSPATKLISNANVLANSNKDDLRYENLGEKVVSEEELKNLNTLRNTPTEGYTPSGLKESISSQKGELIGLNRDYDAHESNKSKKDNKDSIKAKCGVLVTQIRRVLGPKSAADEYHQKIQNMCTNLLEQGEHAQNLYVEHRHQLENDSSQGIRQKRAKFEKYISMFSDFYYRFIEKEDPSLRDAFAEFIGFLNATLEDYDKYFRKARARETEKQFEGSDIEDQLRFLNKDEVVSYEYGKNENQESNPIIQIALARKGISFEQITKLQKENTGNKKSVMNALFLDAYNANRNIWQKEEFTQEDADLAFKTMQNNQKDIRGRNPSFDTEKDYNFTGTETLQALIFNRIYGGLRSRIKSGKVIDPEMEVESFEEAAEKVVAWLKQDLRLSSRSHPAEVQQILNSIASRQGKKMAEMTDADWVPVYQEYNQRLTESYIYPVIKRIVMDFMGEGDKKLTFISAIAAVFGLEIANLQEVL